MVTGRRIRWAALLAMPVILGGCMRAVQLEQFGQTIAFACPHARLNREVSLSLGPMSMGLIRTAAGFSRDGRDERRMLSGVHRLQVVVYELGLFSAEDRADMPRVLRDVFEGDDWQLLVKTVDKDEMVWIHYREDGDMVRDMHLTVLDSTELVLVRLSGHLNTLFDEALKDDHNLTAMLDHARH